MLLQNTDEKFFFILFNERIQTMPFFRKFRSQILNLVEEELSRTNASKNLTSSCSSELTASQIVERKLMDRTILFNDKVCPYCFSVFEKLTSQTRKCKVCGNQVYVTKNLITQEYMILTWPEYSELQTERLNNDFNRFTAEAKYQLSQRQYGLYANAKIDLHRTAHKLKKYSPYQSLVHAFEICYLEFSGPNNVHNIPPNLEPPFRSTGLKFPPFLVDGWLAEEIEAYPQTLEQYHQIFINEMTKLQLPEQKMKPETAWKKIKKYIESYLETEDLDVD